ncbi:MAG: hypothetical protein HY561_03845 [Gemmatimonadetes bacterium]|nr:hypothetical protein [Gemmatimonadota bacterium]
MLLARRWALTGAVLAALAAGAVPPLFSQEPTPTDTAAVLLNVAQQLETEGRTELAEALFALILRRWPDSAAARTVGERLARLRATRIDRSGRVELIVWSTLYGLWLGFAVPAALGADDPEPYGLGLLVGGPLGFFASKSYSERRAMSDGQAGVITFGGNWGTWQAFGWREVFDWGEREQCYTYDSQRSCYETDPSTETVFTTLVLGGLAGLATAAAFARKDITAGTSTLVNFGALWGSWYGVASSVVFDVEDGDQTLAWTLVGGNAGLLAMAVIAPRWQISRARARLISIAGVAGLVGGFGLDLLAQPESEEMVLLIPMITSAAGLVAGAQWTKDYDARQRGRFENGAGDALLELRDGRLSFGGASPGPVLLPERGRDGRLRWSPGVKLTLVQATF